MIIHHSKYIWESKIIWNTHSVSSIALEVTSLLVFRYVIANYCLGRNLSSWNKFDPQKKHFAFSKIIVILNAMSFCWGQCEESRRDSTLKLSIHLKDRIWTGPEPCPRVRKPLLGKPRETIARETSLPTDGKERFVRLSLLD